MAATGPAQSGAAHRLPLPAAGTMLTVAIGGGVLAFVAYPLAAGLRLLDAASLPRLAAGANIEALANSLLLAALTLVPAAAIGVPLAWLCTRTNLPGRAVVFRLVAVSFVMPPLLVAIAYVFLFSRNAGIVNVFWSDAFGTPLYDVYSFSGVVFVSVLQSYPLIFFTTVAGLAKMNPELEEAGRICGLGPFAVFRRVTLGAILPSVMAGLAFAVAESLTTLAGPLVLGLPVGLRFATTEMYGAIVMTPNFTTAIALSVPLVVVATAALWVQSRLLGDAASARFAILAGKGARSETVDLGRWRRPLLAAALTPVALSLVAPVLTLLAAALMDKWWRGFTLDNLTLANFAYLAGDPTTLSAIANSMILAFGTAAAMAVVGGVLAIALAGEQTPLTRAIRFIAELPLGLPHIVAGLLVLLAWYGAPFRLGGTLWLLAFGYGLVMLPYAARTCEAARGQIDATLGEAARIAGCSPLQTWRHVTLPLMRHGIATTALIVFLFTIKEFSLTAMAYSAPTQTLAVRVYTFLEGGSYEKTAAAAIVLLLLTFASLAAAGRLFKISLASLTM